MGFLFDVFFLGQPSYDVKEKKCASNLQCKWYTCVAASRFVFNTENKAVGGADVVAQVAWSVPNAPVTFLLPHFPHFPVRVFLHFPLGYNVPLFVLFQYSHHAADNHGRAATVGIKYGFFSFLHVTSYLL